MTAQAALAKPFLDPTRLVLPWGLALAVIMLESGLKSALGQLGQAPWGPKGQRKEAGNRLVGSRWRWPWGVSRLLPRTSSFLPGPLTSLLAPYQVPYHLHSGAHPPPSVPTVKKGPGMGREICQVAEPELRTWAPDSLPRAAPSE